MHRAPYDHNNFREEARSLLSALKKAHADAVRAAPDMAGAIDVRAAATGEGEEEDEARAAAELLAADGDAGGDGFGYRDLLVFGDAPLEKADDAALEALRRRGAAHGALAAYYKHTFPDDVRSARDGWQRDLEATVEALLGPHDAANAAFDVLMQHLVRFADNADGGDRAQETQQRQLARMFFRYLFEKIGGRIAQEGLLETVTGMLDREKRGSVDFLELQPELARVLKHPERLAWFFGDANAQMAVPLFSAEWTRAYLNAVARRSSDDIFRIMAVRLLEPLIFECIRCARAYLPACACARVRVCSLIACVCLCLCVAGQLLAEPVPRGDGGGGGGPPERVDQGARALPRSAARRAEALQGHLDTRRRVAMHMPTHGARRAARYWNTSLGSTYSRSSSPSDRSSRSRKRSG